MANRRTKGNQNTRGRGPRPYWDKDWLRAEYVDAHRSAFDIAQQFGVTENAILHWLRKLGIPTRTMSETRAIKHWGLSGPANGMFGKTGDANPNWRGGCTAGRQAFYCSREWAGAVQAVWFRDLARCQRCGEDGEHIHHIVSFAVVELRTEVDNLVLLCRSCHHWVHSRENVNGEYRKEV